MPSGKPSISLLLQTLGHRGDRFERCLRLQFLCDDRRLQTFGGDVQLIVDDDVVVKLFPGVDLVDGLLQSGLNLVFTVQAAVAETLLEMVERRRKDEDVERPRLEIDVFGDLPGPLIVDIEDDVLAPVEPRENLGFRSPVPLLMNEGPFDKFPACHHGLELFGGNEVITAAVDFARARLARGVRDREVEGDSDRLELLADGVDQRRLSGTRWARDDEQRPIGVEVTRHSVPARVSARPRFSILQRGSAEPRSATSSPWC